MQKRNVVIRTIRAPVIRYDALNEWFKRVAASITKCVRNINIFGETKVNDIYELIGEMSSEPPREPIWEEKGTSPPYEGPRKVGWSRGGCCDDPWWSWTVTCDGELKISPCSCPKGFSVCSPLDQVDYYWAPDQMRYILDNSDEKNRNWMDVSSEHSLLSISAYIDTMHRDARAKKRAKDLAYHVKYGLFQRARGNAVLDRVGNQNRGLTTGSVRFAEIPDSEGGFTFVNAGVEL
jgi:hypothetical protein